MAHSPKQSHLKNYLNTTWSRKIIAWILLFLTAAQPILVSAEVIADSKASVQNRPTVETSASNIPVVQITAPSAAGVSRNFYQQFNVDSKGLILNNSRVVTQTQLAGYITGNPNLANGSARIILNEVTSNNPSYLRGYTEVAGQKAEVIIANPNGIYGDGFGFINTSRAILTTGTPVFGGSGSLDAFRVTGGQIAIQGKGMNASDIDRVDLISRAVSINAGMYAKQLNVAAGANQVNYNTLQAQAIAGDASTPQVQIDIGQLGGMYAQKIYMVGTEKGVGVNSQGVISSTGDVSINSEGKVTLAQTSAGGNITVSANDQVTNQNSLYAQGNTTINAQGDIKNSGILASGQKTSLTAQTISSTGTLGAGITSDSKVGTTGDLILNANSTVTTRGQNIAAGNLSIQGTALDLSSSTTTAGGNTTLIATQGDINNTSGSIQTGKVLTASAQGTIHNDQDANGVQAQISAGQLKLAAANITNKNSKITQTGIDDATIVVTNTLDNTGGQIGINGTNVSLQACSVLNSQGKIQHAGAGALKIQTTGDLTNATGTIATNGSANLTAGTLNNTKGSVTALQTMGITGNNVTNDQGIINAGGNMTIGLQNALSNQGGTVESGTALNISAQAVANQGGNITSLDSSGVTVEALQTIDNTNGTIGGKGNVNLTAQTLTNNSGKVLSKGTLTAAASSTLDNTGGTIAAGSNLSAQAKTLNNTGGAMAADQDISLTAKNVTSVGTVIAGQDVTITVEGDVTSASDSIVKANRDLTVTAITLQNEGSLSAVRSVTMNAKNVANTGSIFADSLTMTADTISNNGAKAVIATTKDINLYAKTSLENKDDANIYSMGNINIAGSKNQDANGQYIDRTGSALNQSATMQADGNIRIAADTITNKKREFVTEQQVVSTTQYAPQRWWNTRNYQSQWGVFYQGDIRFSTTPPNFGGRAGDYFGYADKGVLLNKEGFVLAPHITWLMGETVSETKVVKDSPRGKILAGKDMQLKASAINNDQSIIQATDSFTADTNTIHNSAVGLVRSSTKIILDEQQVYGGYTDNGGHSNSGVIGFDFQTSSVTTNESLPDSQASLIGGGKQVSIKAVDINNKTVNPSGVVVKTNNNPTTSGSVGDNLQTLLPSAQSKSAVTVPQTTNGDHIVVPTNNMYSVHQEPASKYLVETNPRFSNYKTFISSDYMLNQLGITPASTMKRLGDGFYEQQKVREQVIELTGRAVLKSYSSAEDQYKVLLDDGAKYAKEFNLQVGIALTADQMAKLTSDMVWMVEKEVDGQKVLVPVVYLAQVRSGDLKADGALIAGDTVNLVATGDVNNAGVIKATEKATINAVNINNYGGTMDGGKTTDLRAAQDIVNLSGTIKGDQVNLKADKDIKNETATLNSNSTSTNITKTYTGNIGSIHGGNSFSIEAGRDITINGAAVSGDQDVTLKAGGNLNIGSVQQQERLVFGNNISDSVKNTVSTISGKNVNLETQGDATLKGAQFTATNNLALNAKGNVNLSVVKDETINDQTVGINDGWKRTRTDNETVIGTNLQGGNQVTINAGHLPGSATTNPKGGNIDIEGSYISSDKGKVNISADKDVTIKEVTEKNESLVQTHTESDGFFSSTTTDTMDHSLINQVKGSTISGDQVTVSSGKDLTVQGSNVVGTNDVTLTATNNVNITSAKETGKDEYFREEKTSGLFSGGGIGFTIGSKSEKTTTTDKTLNQVGSTIGSTNGNVTVKADNQVVSAGTTLVAGKDVNITGKDVTIDNTVNTVDSQTKYEFKQSGLTVSLGGGAVTAAANAAGDIKRSSQVEDGRLKALYDYKAAQDIKKLGESKGNLKKDVSISISIGSSQMTSEQTSHTETVNTSNINAGGNVNVTANAGDINLKATNMNAANVNLDAAKNINIDGAQNKQQTTSNTSSSSWSVGGTIGTGFSANVSKGSGNENENAITNTGSVITASDNLKLKSGDDTNISSSQVKGDKVVATIGGNLNIASKQDTDNYTANDKNSGFGINTGPTGGVTGSISKGKTDSNYASVTNQAGIFAGKGGFDITVGKNTDLKGAVIASTATPDKNKLSTDTLTYSDIQNKADYNSSSIGVNVNTSKDAKYNERGITPNIGVPASGNADSTTKSAVSNGTIEVRSNPNMDLSKLSRDTTNSLNALGKIFDKETVKEKQELAGVFGQLAYEEVHKISKANGWDESSPQKIALHAFVGGIMSNLGGSSFTSGAVGAGVNEIVQKELLKLKDQPDMWQWASAIIGAAASKAVGGNAQAGASTAASGTKNNGQLENLNATIVLGSLAIGGVLYIQKKGLDGTIYLVSEAGKALARWNDDVGKWVSIQEGNGELAAKNQQLIDELNSKTELNQQIKNQTGQATTSIGTQENQLKVMNTQIADTKTGIAGMQVEIANAQTEIVRMKAEIANTQAEMANIKAETADSQAQIANLEALNNKLRIEVANLETKRDKLQAEVASLQKQLDVAFAEKLKANTKPGGVSYNLPGTTTGKEQQPTTTTSPGEALPITGTPGTSNNIPNLSNTPMVPTEDNKKATILGNPANNPLADSGYIILTVGKMGNTEFVWPSKPHTNATEGHWETIVEEANRMAQSGLYDKIYVNKGLSNEIPGAKPNRRPDIMGVRKDGKIDQVEVPSKTDMIGDLVDRMKQNQQTLGDRAGDIRVKDIKK